MKRGHETKKVTVHQYIYRLNLKWPRMVLIFLCKVVILH